MPVRFLFFCPLLRARPRARGRRVGGGRGSIAGNGEAGVWWPLGGVGSPDPNPPGCGEQFCGSVVTPLGL